MDSYSEQGGRTIGTDSNVARVRVAVQETMLQHLQGNHCT